jgi:uncharacterized protein
MAGRTPERRISLTDRLNKPGPRKLLALDGGGIRGVLSLLILARIEELLVKQSGRTDYRLADYFDYERARAREPASYINPAVAHRSESA